MSEAGKVSLPAQKLKKGDRVVMHTCGEAESHQGKIWTCKTDQFTRGTGVYEQDSVFLEGYSGSFAPEFLQKVILPSEDESLLAALEEAQQQNVCLNEESLANFQTAAKRGKALGEANAELSQLHGELVEVERDRNYAVAKANSQAQRLSNAESRLNKVVQELAEAQQTIALLESELEEMTIDRNIWRSNSTDWEGQEELEEEEGETQP